MRTIETSDLFRSAYFLAQGAQLAEIRVAPKGRVHLRATFRIRGETVPALDLAYQRGLARVDPVRLEVCLNQLRDLLFEALRDHSPTRG